MIELLRDPFFLRGLERLLICVGGIFCSYLGYKLFRFGHETGKGRLTAGSELYKITFSGQGPGLFFMAFGALVLISALYLGGVSDKQTQASNESKAVQENTPIPASTRVERELVMEKGSGKRERVMEKTK